MIKEDGKVKRALLIFCIAGILFCMGGCTDKSAETNSEKDEAQQGYYTAEDYINDPTLFVPVWADKREVPAEMLDFEEKWEQFFTPDGRTMSSAHRGDNAHYPENSTEAYLSAIMLGADIVEVDVAMTKDNIPVVMHDETLERTTNLLQLREANVPGLPKSNAVSDWTLAQLRRLKLLSNNDGGVTNYVIPTLEDVIMLCNGRVFITLDKSGNFDWHQDIVPLLEKHDAYRTVMLPYMYSYSLTFDRVKELMDEIYTASGYQSPLMSRAADITQLERVSKLVLEYGFPKVLRCGEYSINEVGAYQPYFDQFRIHIECLKAINDKAEMWERIDGEGYNLIVTNDIYGLTEFIQNKYF